jgi:predicted regulator of Ras-like GTPase activity (Roadblock/LC7/MglB family)/DNA-binding response OmpR family regulator
MKKVLIVDDEEDMLWMLQRNLDSTIPNIETFIAQSGKEALSILNESEISLVITDINMPGMSGLELLTEISSKWPSTKVIIITAYPSSAFENTATREGAVKFVEKPFDINTMRTIVEDALSATPTNSAGSGIALMDLIHFNGLAKSTSALQVTKDGEIGTIYFQDGKIIHAQIGNDTAEAAFFRIIDIEGAELQNLDGVTPASVTMGKTVESLLLEAAVLQDEKEYAVGTAALTESTSKSSPGTVERGSNTKDRAAEAPTFQTSEAPPSTEGSNMTEVQKILAEFTNIDGVHTACLVGRDGFLLDSLARTGIDAEMISAIASSGFGSAESMGNQLGQGDLNMTMLEYTEGPVLFAPVGSEAFLVIVADKDTNLGWIRIAIKKNSMKIEKVAAL